MSQNKTVILTEKQISQKIDRIAFQIYEDNPLEHEIILAGIAPNGYNLAKKLQDALQKISPLKATLIKVTLDKDDHLKKPVELSVSSDEIKGKTIVLVDDVLNSGKTLIYGLKPFLNADVKKLRLAVLVDRNHRRFPVYPDFVGLSLATTLQEHITVQIENGEKAVYLS